MKYTRNAVYTRICNAVKVDYPDANCTSRYVPKPSEFPSVYIHEIDNFRTLRGIQLDFEDVQWESAFEVQVVSNKHGTAASEAYAIMEIVQAAFNKLYYRQFQQAVIDGGDKFTVIGRFRRKIGGGDTMPDNELQSV